MSEQRDLWVRTRIYLFIRDYGYDRKVYLPNIKAYARTKSITPQEMGYALQVLKEKRAIRFNRRHGWVAKT